MQITISRLRELLRYDRVTGQFFWKISRPRRQKGQVAGGINRTLGYRIIGLDGQRYYAHDVAWAHVYGEWPSRIEFINGDGTDIRIGNLRDRVAAAHAPETKICPICSSSFVRPKDLSGKQWTIRVFCGKKCAEEYKRRTALAKHRCSKCGSAGPFKIYTTKSGFRGRHSLCKHCFNEARREPRRANYRRNVARKPEWYLYLRMKNNARHRRNPVAVTMTYAEFLAEIGGKMPSQCPVFGIELDVLAPANRGNLPTVDRIDSTKPYQSGNIAVISWRANAVKNDGTADEHRRIADWMEQMRRK